MSRQESSSRYTNTLSIFELMELFPTNASARDYFESTLWGDTPRCAYCSNQTPGTIYKHPSRQGLCRCCSQQFTIQTNTVMHASKIPLRKWLYGMYLIVTARTSISSYQLAKELGLTQKSAWFMGHRIRAACKDGDNLLSGMVEIDETYFGGKEKNKHEHQRTQGTQGRSTKTKTAVVGMRTRDGEVRATSMNPVNSTAIQETLDQQVEKGSTLCTDEATIYKPIHGHHKLMVNHSVGEFVNGMASTNGIEIVRNTLTVTFKNFVSDSMVETLNTTPWIGLIQ